MLYLMGFDLLTGVFMLTPLALLDKRPGVTMGGILRNWGLVFVGNFAGALTVAVMMAFVFTYGFSTDPGPVGTKIASIGVARTLGYAQYGVAGWFTIFIRGMLCNWMVSMGVVGAMISTSVSGKVIAMWMPILLFFAMTFEHSVVNMFLFPSAMIMGGDFSIADYFIWNEIPTVLGNLVGGIAFTGLTLYTTHVRTAPKRNIADIRTAPERSAA
jgi:formate/nitrite transporter FocA (FNT family)